VSFALFVATVERKLRHPMKLIPFVLLAVLTVTARAATDQDAIKATRLQQNAAIAAFKVDEVAAAWTDDVTICRGLGTQLAGKAAYRKLFESDAPSPTQIVYQREPTAIDVSPHWPLAFETGVWTGHLGGVNGTIVISGRYSAQWVKRAGKWLIRSEVFVALEGSGPGLAFKAAP
jgi:ketosteroid isomerase-like protein